jgi:hypothetical protein
MAARKAAAAPAAAPPLSPTTEAPAPHWQVARLAEPGQVFTEKNARGDTVTVVADARGVVIPATVEQNALVDRLPVASPQILAAPIPDAHPTEPTDDAGDEPGEED